MSHPTALRQLRDELEHQPEHVVIWAPKDADAALDALRAGYGESYDFGIDGAGYWVALRRDGLPGLIANGPDALLAAIWADKPVKLP